MSSTWASVVPAGKVPKDTTPTTSTALCPSWRAGFSPIPTKSGASRAAGLICGSWERRRPGPASAASRSLQKIVGAIVGAASRTGREHLRGSIPLPGPPLASRHGCTTYPFGLLSFDRAGFLAHSNDDRVRPRVKVPRPLTPSIKGSLGHPDEALFGASTAEGHSVPGGGNPGDIWCRVSLRFVRQAPDNHLCCRGRCTRHGLPLCHPAVAGGGFHSGATLATFFRTFGGLHRIRLVDPR